ncbi:hypothetical protein TNCV_4993181 [Trichonephila clavipes]|nr:hypothetical protein TNCV_4993181 [Trichonephila clavipes]
MVAPVFPKLRILKADYTYQVDSIRLSKLSLSAENGATIHVEFLSQSNLPWAKSLMITTGMGERCMFERSPRNGGVNTVIESRSIGYLFYQN